MTGKHQTVTELTPESKASLAQFSEGENFRERIGALDRVCGELLILAENTSEAQSCESFTYH
jgi:hypothetical protein